MFEAMTHGVLGLVVMLLLLVIWIALLNWVMGKVDAFRDKKRKIQTEVKRNKKGGSKAPQVDLMNIDDAEMIIDAYGSFFLKPETESNHFHRESELPFTKTQIRQAIMLDLANHIYCGTLTENYKNILTSSVSTLAYFYKDAEADKLNHAYRLGKHGSANLASEEKITYRTALDESRKSAEIGFAVRMELEDFVEIVKKIAPKDPIFWQRVYTLCGLPYTPPKKKSFLGLF